MGLLVALSVALPSFQPGDVVQVLGIGSVAIGFAFRDILQNVLAGILLLITQPFRIGDQIVAKGHEGTVEEIQTRAGRQVSGIEKAALDHLSHYDWPGNVRELQNIVERACILAGSRAIAADHVQVGLGSGRAGEVLARSTRATVAPFEDSGRLATMAEIERMAIIRALKSRARTHQRAARPRCSGRSRPRYTHE